MINFMKKIILFLSFLFPLFSEAKLPPSIATGGNSLNVIFAIDVSGSMSWFGDLPTNYPNYSVTATISGNVFTATTNCSNLRVGRFISDISSKFKSRLSAIFKS